MKGSAPYDRGLLQTIDWWIVGCYLLLVLFGWMNIYASVHGSEPSSIFDPVFRSGKQFIWLLASVGVGAVIVFFVNPRIWEMISSPLFLLVLALLFIVIFVARDIKGSRSWFTFGPVSFQPAEVSKITTSLMLAAVLSVQDFSLSRRKDLLMVLAVLGLPMIAILCEKETGSMLVYTGYLFVLYREGMSGWVLFAAGLAILLFILTLVAPLYVPIIVLAVVMAVYHVAGLQSWASATHNRRRHLRITLGGLALGLLLIFSSGYAFEHVLQDHQRKRVEVLLGLTEDPSGVGYNVRQAKIAIGSGGFFGKGYLGGTQTTYGFVPEQSTDFIFCTVGEEWGFLGCLFVIALYCLMIFRIVKDSEESREAFTRIYGYCVAACLFMHLIINIGMTVGLMPVIGIPLPLFSYGGSSLLTFTVLISIFLALNRQEKKYF